MTATAVQEPPGSYRHEAYFYDDDAAFMHGTLGFIRDGIAADEPVLVVLAAERIAALRADLGADAPRVAFADMNDVGSNPARIIPAWHEFLAAHAAGGRRVRGIGEPIWAGRSADELHECQRDEALLNLAFDDPAFWLLCPYDTTALDADVIAEARRSHPFVRAGGRSSASSGFAGSTAIAQPFGQLLSDAPPTAIRYPFEQAGLREVRAIVAREAEAAGLAEARAAELMLAVYEISTNSVQHGGGTGTLRVWRDASALVCEVRDEGRLTDPMLGRVRPPIDATGGRGLWLANQLCDLAQTRSHESGTVTRLHMRLP